MRRRWHRWAVLWAIASTACEGVTAVVLRPVGDAEVPNDRDPAQASADFDARCGGPDVLLCQGFDGPLPRQDAGFHGIFENDGTIEPPVIDEQMWASGSGALRLTIAPLTRDFDAGGFFTNLSEDLSIQIAEGEQLYVQWRQRFSPAFIDNRYFEGQGWKQVRVGEGDRPGIEGAYCSPIYLEVYNAWFRNVPQLAHSCGAKDGARELFEVTLNENGEHDLQPGGDNQCLLSELTTPCMQHRADQWMTFQVGIQVGTWYLNDGNYNADSVIDLWVAYEGEPSVHTVHVEGVDLANEDPQVGYGKIWLHPEIPNKNGDEQHTAATTWYDELIVSRSRIADPEY